MPVLPLRGRPFDDVPGSANCLLHVGYRCLVATRSCCCLADILLQLRSLVTDRVSLFIGAPTPTRVSPSAHDVNVPMCEVSCTQQDRLCELCHIRCRPSACVCVCLRGLLRHDTTGHSHAEWANTIEQHNSCCLPDTICYLQVLASSLSLWCLLAPLHNRPLSESGLITLNTSVCLFADHMCPCMIVHTTCYI